jgi:hypothetical protein
LWGKRPIRAEVRQLRCHPNRPAEALFRDAKKVGVGAHRGWQRKLFLRYPQAFLSSPMTAPETIFGTMQDDISIGARIKQVRSDNGLTQDACRQ